MAKKGNNNEWICDKKEQKLTCDKREENKYENGIEYNFIFITYKQ